MRTHALYALLMTTAFLALAAGAALAQPPSGDREARQERMKELHAARNASIAMFKENRSAAIAEYRADHNETKRSFLENKTRVIDECKASKAGDEDAAKQCVRDGVKPLIEKARAEHKGQRESLRETLLAAREAAKANFMAARQRAPSS